MPQGGIADHAPHPHPGLQVEARKNPGGTIARKPPTKAFAPWKPQHSAIQLTRRIQKPPGSFDPFKTELYEPVSSRRMLTQASTGHQARGRDPLVPSLDWLSHAMPWLASRFVYVRPTGLKPPGCIGHETAHWGRTKFLNSETRNTTCLIAGEAGRGSRSRGEKQTGSFNRTE